MITDINRSSGMEQSTELLTVVPPELLAIILSQLGPRDLACLAGTCRLLWYDAPTPPPTLPTQGLVETELRRRAEARALHIRQSPPKGTLSCVPYLLRRELCDTQRREPPLAVGEGHSHFVDRDGCLHLACSRAAIQAGKVGEPLLGHDWGSDAGDSVPPTLVPSMQDKRIVSVAAGDWHFLALSAEGEVYSWGVATDGALGHADWSARVGPRRIETLARIESIAAGACHTSAAVDDRGRVFTWGRARWTEGAHCLGYQLDPETEFQPTPKRVDAFLKDRVVGIAFGNYFTLAVTDAGAVFSFGHCGFGALGHGWSTDEVLPRKIEALAETGRRFVAVAAGCYHALAITEEGHIYGWGHGSGNGHWQHHQRTPLRIAALYFDQVKLVYAKGFSSCAITEKGELFTWGGTRCSFNVGHGVDGPQRKPKRVEALSRVKVAAAAICDYHTLVAGEDGVVLAFAPHAGLSLGNGATPSGWVVVQPTPISTLRVRTLP